MFSTEDWWGKKNKKRKEKKYLRTSALENDNFIVVFVYLKHCFSRLFLDICRMTLVAHKVIKKNCCKFSFIVTRIEYLPFSVYHPRKNLRESVFLTI